MYNHVLIIQYGADVCLGAQNFSEFQRISVKNVNLSEKTHIFRKGPPFFEILRKWRTLPKGRICQNFLKCHKMFLKCIRILQNFLTFCRCPCINNPICMRCLPGPPEYPCNAHIQKKSNVLKILCINNLGVFNHELRVPCTHSPRHVSSTRYSRTWGAGGLAGHLRRWNRDPKP